MKNKSFLLNLIIQHSILMLILTSVLFLVSYNLIRSNYISNLVDKLDSDGILIENIVRGDLESGSMEKMQSKLYEISKYIKARITIIKTNGVVIFDSDEDYRLMENHSNRIEVREAMSGKIGKSIRHSKTLKSDMLYVARPVKDNGRIVGIARLSIMISYIQKISDSFRIKIILLFLLVLSLSLLIAVFSFVRNTKPIRDLSEASKKLAEGELGTRLYLSGTREIETLSRNFNTMAAELSRHIEELKNEKEELKGIFDSAKEGIIVIDGNGKIIRSNDSFLEIAGVNRAEGRYYWEIVKEAEIINIIKDENREKPYTMREINLNGRILLAGINYLGARDNFLIIFHDITGLRNLEIIKREFVSNVSHELHTPLTAIRGFVETLVDEETDKNKLKYLEIINKHTQRLVNIVKDLLTLSRLEAANLDDINKKLNMEKINLEDMKATIMGIFEDRLDEKNLKADFRVLEQARLIEGDYFKLEEMFINLIDNAIKYTDKGEIKILVSNHTDKNFIKIEIADTGIGIPEKDLARIFERFYVVDKSRSKMSGGTGLGLSIVKHVVLLHHGEIKVTSRLDEGTNFTVILPKKAPD